MTKQEVLDQVGREVQDTSAGFLAILSLAYNWVVLELAQRGVIAPLMKKATFNFTASQSTYSTTTVCGLSAGNYPAEVTRLLVPTWGAEGKLYRLSDAAFEEQVLCTGVTTTGRARWWRLYPNDTTLEVFPIPDTDNSGGSYPVTITFRQSPTTLGDNDTITEIRLEDLPTVKAGLAVQGVKFRDETYQDRTEALAKFEQGIVAMRLRNWDHKFKGRDLRVKPRSWSL